MPLKKKVSAAAAPSTSLPPPPEQTGGGLDAGGRTDVDEEAHDAARSKDKAAQTSASVHVAHLRRRRTDNVMVFAVPYVRWDKIELVDLGVLKTSMHANVLARVKHVRLDEMLLLLT